MSTSGQELIDAKSRHSTLCAPHRVALTILATPAPPRVWTGPGGTKGAKSDGVYPGGPERFRRDPGRWAGGLQRFQ